MEAVSADWSRQFEASATFSHEAFPEGAPCSEIQQDRERNRFFVGRGAQLIRPFVLRLAPFLRRGLAGRAHLFGGQILHALRERPLVPPLVSDRAHPVAP